MSLALLCIELINKNIIFDYATEFKLNNKEICETKDFTLSDSIYNDFKKFAIAKEFRYENNSQEGLKKLIEVIKKENFYEKTKDILDSLEAKLQHNTEEELEKYRSEVSQMLSAEIVKRYYFSKGEAQESLKTDKVLELSIEILNDPKRYNEILKGK